MIVDRFSYRRIITSKRCSPDFLGSMRAEGAAWKLTEDYCLDTPGPTPVEDIAMDHGIVCLEANPNRI